MKKRKMKSALAVRAEQALIQQLPVEERTLRRLGKLMEPKNIKRLALAAVGGSFAVSVFGSIGQARMYRLEMRRELKKQLDSINDKLEELEKQNEELREQNEKLQRSLAVYNRA